MTGRDVPLRASKGMRVSPIPQVRPLTYVIGETLTPLEVLKHPFLPFTCPHCYVELTSKT